MLNFINSVPSKHMSKLFNSKILLKDIASGLIPKEIIERPKMGFVIPKENWLKKELLENLILYSSSTFIKKQEIFSHEYVKNSK